MVAAYGDNRVIGADGAIPWRIPEDFAHFKALTLGHTLVMGRATWDSIGRPLPGRRSIVISRNRGLALEGATVVHSLTEALRAADDAPEACVIGGADMFGQALPVARIIELTRVHAVVDADTWFPPIDEHAWCETGRERHPADAQHAWPFTFITLERRTARAGSSRDQRG